MSKARKNGGDEMRSEYDLRALGPGVRGKFFALSRKGERFVRLEADVAAAFPDDRAVNRALRQVMRAGARPVRVRRPRRAA